MRSKSTRPARSLNGKRKRSGIRPFEGGVSVHGRDTSTGSLGLQEAVAISPSNALPVAHMDGLGHKAPMPERFELNRDLMKRARKAKRLSQEALAERLDVSHQAVGQWERGESSPSRNNLLALARALELGVDELAVVHQTERVMGPAQELARIPDAQKRLGEGDRSVPVLGVAVGGVDADFYQNGTIVDYVRRPPAVANARNLYALYVMSDSMSPRFEQGELVYVNPDRPPSVGDDIVIELHPEKGERTGKGYIKRLVRRSGSKLVVEQFNPAQELEFPAERVKSCHRIVPLHELLGI